MPENYMTAEEKAVLIEMLKKENSNIGNGFLKFVEDTNLKILERSLSIFKTKKNFPGLQLVAKINQIVAFLFVIFFLLFLVLFVFTLIMLPFQSGSANNYSGMGFPDPNYYISLLKLFGYSQAMIASGLLALVLYASGESIFLSLSIEEHTRKSAELLDVLISKQ
ncbi:MAG TPA: hypothetical protein PK299_12755 [Anaerolineales bacterium]|nr:hypothetical protein [Anaerolineales bacterium]